jgi:hypothetical protein
MLEIIKIKRDIQWLYNNVRCLLNKSNVETPLSATEWSANHNSFRENQYTAGTYVFYNGHVYKCKFDNDSIPPTNTTYWLDLGEGNLLAEEQTDWNATGGRSYILNRPTSTSDFTNDGEDGTSPFVTQEELAEAIPDPQNLDEVLAEGNDSLLDANINKVGLWDNFVAPFGYATLSVNKSILYFKDKVGAYVASISLLGIQFYKGVYNFNVSIPTLTANRTASFQDKTGVVAYLSDVALPVEVTYQVNGGTSGNPPVFNGAPLFSGSYVIVGPLVHFQIQVDMDNITNFGTGQYYVKLPFTSKYGYMFRCGCLHDFSTGREYHISGHVFAGSDTMELFTSDTQGNNLYDFPFTSTEPVPLSTADNFHIAGSYISNFASIYE